MPRLKVFKAHMGFFDSVVAAPSQKAALEAWGTRQDLFHEGLAEVTDEPEAQKAALARPGVVLRRAAGSKAAYAQDAPPPAAPAARRSRGKGKAKTKATAAATAAKPAPAPDRSALAAAERALAEAERKHDEAAQALDRQRRQLDAEARELDDAFAAEKRGLQRALDKARRAYQRAGGT